jgi:glycogen operon protein
MKEHPVLRRRRFLEGRRLRGAEVKDIMWLTSDGLEMTEAEWNADHVKCLGVRLDGEAIGEVDDHGEPIAGETLVYLMNAGSELVPFTLPSFTRRCWECLLDTADERRVGRIFPGGKAYPLEAHALAVFARRPD